jgi:hypothetical protein
MDNKHNLPPKDDQSSKGVFKNKGRHIKESRVIKDVNDIAAKTNTNHDNNNDIINSTTQPTKIKKVRNVLETSSTCTRSKEEIKESIELLQSQLKRRQDEIKHIETKEEVKLDIRRDELQNKRKEYEFHRNQNHLNDKILLSLIGRCIYIIYVFTDI